MEHLFADATLPWHGVSPKLATVRRILVLIGVGAGAVTLAVLAALDLVPGMWLGIGAALLVLIGAWGWWIVGRVQRRWRWAETDEELHVASGALFRRLVVVPYGRLQYVDVRSGPLDQLAGIASVQVHTASPVTSATIPGLPGAEAARLRDRLTASAESTAAGL